MSILRNGCLALSNLRVRGHYERNSQPDDWGPVWSIPEGQVTTLVLFPLKWIDLLSPHVLWVDSIGPLRLLSKY